MTPWLLALDFGGTKHTAAVLARGERQWRALRRVFSPLSSPPESSPASPPASPPAAGAQWDIRTMLDLARQLLAGDQPAAIGVSFGGPVDAATNTVRLSHHVPGWENIPLGEILTAEFGAPARVDNDANVAALGEQRFGAGQGYDSLMYITVSTGVGGGWILDGRPWRGSDGMAGEIGHTVVDPHGPLCLCGKRGCVERLASGPYMAGDARLLLLAHPERGRILRDLVSGDLATITGQTLSQAAAQGDELAQEVLDRGAWALGVGIGNAANLVNPQRFVLGGGVTRAGERFWVGVRQAARHTALPEVHIDIVPAALGDDAPLWGAVALAEDGIVQP